MQPGFAAKAALLSVQLAKREIRGAQHAFDGIDGLFRTYLRDAYDPELLRAELGMRFELEGLSYKPYPCCRFNHTAIDAALMIRQEKGFRADRVKHIHSYTNNQAYEAVCTPIEIRRAPTTIVQAQFSIPYTVASALVDGQVGLAHFTSEGLKRDEILKLAALTHCSVDADIERDWGRSISPTLLKVETDDGIFEARGNYPRGHEKMPMRTADFEMKLADCMTFSELKWPEGLANKFRAFIETVEIQPRAAALADMLRHS
jgi:2-methylcitrate dehydratase PrpD